jgi:hypothetical protein
MPDMSDPVAEFQRGWSDMSGPRPRHVRVSEGIGLPIYRLGRSIFGRFPPVIVDFLADRPTIAPPARFPTESGHFSPRRHGFFGRLPALAPHPIYQPNRRLPLDSNRFSPRRR